MMIYYGFAFVIACLVCLVATPWVARLATILGVVDQPDGGRKTHARITPLGGGIAVLLASLAAIAVTLVYAQANSAWVVENDLLFLWGVGGAVSVILLVGLADDAWGMRGIYKLAGQAVAVSILLASGLVVNQIALAGWTLPLGSLAIPFTMFFYLGAINAFNLIDGADGLASSVGIVVCLTLAVLTMSLGNVVGAVLCLALAGALLGFLRYNFSPATVFLGDTGSMLIGLVVASVAVECSVKAATATALSVPIAICAIPILDALAAIIRRTSTGRSVFSTDRGHMHHFLLNRGWSVRRTVLFITGLCAITCGGALASFFWKTDIFALTAMAVVVIGLVVGRVFGHVEFLLVRHHAHAAARLVFLPKKNRGEDAEHCVHLQGSREWQTAWVALREAAPDYGLVCLRLNVSLPSQHESFYASWKQSERDPSESDATWRLEVPLSVEGRRFGKLLVVGRSENDTAAQRMAEVLDFVEPIEEEFQRIAGAVQSIASVDSQPERSFEEAGIAESAIGPVGLVPSPSLFMGSSERDA